MNANDTLLYLSADDVTAVGLGPAELIAAVEQAFAEYADGKARIGAKAPLPVNTGHFFQAIVGAVATPAYAGMKWFGVVPDNPARGLPNVSSLIVLNDADTGLPIAVIDGNWITGARTAAMSAAAAIRLALPRAATAAFIGCGVQARSHALYLKHVLPGLREAVLLGRGQASRDSFASWLRESGWRVRIAEGPDDAIANAQVAVSTVPEYPGWQPFLDPARLAPGTLAISVDLGRSWLPAGYPAFDRVATDDAAQSLPLVADGRLRAPAAFDTDLVRLVTGADAGRRAPDERIYFVFSGNILGDLAGAAAVYQRALALGRGTRLPR